MLRPLFAATSAALVLLVTFIVSAAEPQRPVRQPSGLEKRIPWTASRVIGSPEPPPPYRTARVFRRLTFSEPLDLATAPGTNRLWVAERKGKILSFVNKPDVERADLALDLDGKTIYGMTLHPKFKDNGYVYITWIPDGSREGIPNGSRVSRFTAKGEPPAIDRATEKVIIEWPNGGHNGGCLKFGPDGMLYLVTGDGSGIADELQIGQDLTSIFGKLLRLDVDHPAPGKGYSVPEGQSVRGHGRRPARNLRLRPAAVLALQLRPQDRRSLGRRGRPGPLGDGLQDRERAAITAGPCRKGRIPSAPSARKARRQSSSLSSSIRTAISARSPAASSIAASDCKELAGPLHLRRFRYGPHLGVSAAFRSLRVARAPTRMPRRVRLDWHLPTTANSPAPPTASSAGARTPRANCTSSISPAAASTSSCRTTKQDDSAKFPRKLSETGIFASTKDHTARAGPHSLLGQRAALGRSRDQGALHRHPRRRQDRLRRDHLSAAVARRSARLAVPRRHGARQDLLDGHGTRQPGQRANGSKRGCLHFQQFPGTQEYGDQYWRGYTYVWNDDQTDAELLDATGLDRPLQIKVGEQDGRAELSLSQPGRVHALPHQRRQVRPRREHDADEPRPRLRRRLSPISSRRWSTSASSRSHCPSPRPNCRSSPTTTTRRESLDVRARSYLHSNCSHCHMKWGGGNAEFKLVSTLPLADMGIVNVAPGHGSFGLADAKLLVPGQPEHSIVLHRMKLTGLGRMPHIGSRVPHESAIKLIREWIEQLQ